MIFYNPQLMTDPDSAVLFMVSNPIPFTNAKDHSTGIHLHVHHLIEQAIAAGENPKALIEDYLETTYTDGGEVQEMTSFLMEHDTMTNALWTLQERWQTVDLSIPNESLHYGGMSKNDTIQLYSSITLRTFLETLSMYNR